MRIDDSAEVLGINNRIELAKVDAAFRARKVEELMLAGVTIEKPETVSIDADVRVGAGYRDRALRAHPGLNHHRWRVPDRRLFHP